MTINQIQDEIVDEYSIIEDWMDKYSLLIEEGNSLNNFKEEYRTEQNLIEGCQSRVWLQANWKDNKIEFVADSDAIIVKGIVSLLLRVVNNRTPDEILENELYFIDKIGLREHLSPTRSNGLLAMVKQIRLYAVAYKAKMS